MAKKISPDKSSFENKAYKVIECEYYKRNIWEDPGRICVLGSDDDYINLTLIEKQIVPEYCQTIFNKNSNKMIKTTVFKSEYYPDFFFSSVMHYNENISSELFTGDSFVSIYALLTSDIHKSNSNTSLDFIQLSRYDPIENSGGHANNFERFDDDEKILYLNYFKIIAPTPHMHFASLTNVEKTKKPLKLAINLFDLIDYIVDLHIGENKLLLENDLGMPYLKIKEHPYLYKTTTTESTLKECLDLIKNPAKIRYYEKNDTTKTKQTEKIFLNLLNNNSNNEVEGLLAVFIDLWELACLHYKRDIEQELKLSVKLMTGGAMNELEKESEKDDGMES